MDKTCNMNNRNEKCIHVPLENLKVTDQLRDQSIHGMTILKRNFEEQM
jgi:hypothetical protein